jgi:hypothetical protein
MSPADPRLFTPAIAATAIMDVITAYLIEVAPDRPGAR